MSKCPYCKKPVVLKKTRKDARDYPPEVLKESAGKVNGKQIMYSCPQNQGENVRLTNVTLKGSICIWGRSDAGGMCSLRGPATKGAL